MSLVIRKCVICNRSTNLFNYGVNSCNACKMFFRRVIFGSYPKFCRDNMKCKKKSTVTSKCRYCRFQVCVQSGMMYTPSGTLSSNSINSIDNHQSPDNVSVLINNLIYLDNQRRQKLTNFFVEGDPTMEELAESGSIKFTVKPGNYQMNLDDWGFMAAISTIDFMKKFNFINLMDLEDRKIFLRCTYFNFSIFSTALSALQGKQAAMSFPDGSDVIPGDMYPISRKLENKIRCQLVGRMADLKITNEEFLLLSVVLFCNPALPSLSETGRALISSCQKMYTSALLQHCLHNYQKTGPSRFTDLLSLCHVINRTFENMTHHYILFKFHEPKAKYRKLFG